MAVIDKMITVPVGSHGSSSATFKESIDLYFDTNLHDGLLRVKLLYYSIDRASQRLLGSILF
ncbi:MAG TPA: hypothetical protein VFD46_10380 [Chryseolinea sp.]|nr:hypothetical protein [Chryseolinea sp.]